jgi:TolB-like protein
MGAQNNSFGPFVLDAEAGVLRRDGVAVALGQRGYDLLAALVEADGAAVDKDALMARAWPGLFVEEANLSVQIAALRKALGKAPDGTEWIATVPRVGYRLPRPGRAAEAAPVLQRPTVAVLPFTTPPDDREQAYFADGVVEDLITALSRFKTFAVVSRNTSFAYRERGLDAGGIAALGVRYLVEGTVRRRGAQLRVNVRLVEAAGSTQLWAQQFDGDGAQLFDFLDEMVAAIVGFVEPEVRRAEIERARRKPPGSLDAYDLYLRALPLFRGTSAEVRAEAIRLLEESVRLDPGFATALAHAAWAYERQETFGLGATPEERARAVQLAEAALVAGPDDPYVAAISALVLMALGGQWQRCLAMMGEAVAANPNNPTILSLTAFCNVMFGDLEFGRELYVKAVQISPGALDNYELLVGVGLADLFKRDFAGSVEWSLRSVAANGDWLGAYWTLAAAYAHLDRMDDAHATIAAIRERAPYLRVSSLIRNSSRFPEPFRTQRHDLIVTGLRKAGLPE